MQQRTTSPEAEFIQKRQYEIPRNLALKNDILEVQIFSFLIVLFGFINRFWSLKVLHKNILAQAANLLDAPLVDGEDSNLYDVLRSGESPNPDRQLLHESLRTEISRALETLTPRESDVVRLYFGLGNQHPMTLEEIGETFDLTRERVRQIKEKAIRRLKHTSRSKILKTYLG